MRLRRPSRARDAVMAPLAMRLCRDRLTTAVADICDREGEATSGSPIVSVTEAVSEESMTRSFRTPHSAERRQFAGARMRWVDKAAVPRKTPPRIRPGRLHEIAIYQSSAPSPLTTAALLIRPTGSAAGRIGTPACKVLRPPGRLPGDAQSRVSTDDQISV